MCFILSAYEVFDYGYTSKDVMMCSIDCDSAPHNPETDAFNYANDCLSDRLIFLCVFCVATGRIEAVDEREATTLTKIKLN